MKYLITIIGPTAIGKTALSIQLANHYNCEIISCDSRQFFKEMTIGTAVPNDKELAAAKHHFIQNKSIFENYTVGDFEKEAMAIIEELFKTNDYVVLVGGSGLYVNAILQGFDDFPEIDSAIRQEVNANYEKLGIGYLQEQLKKRDPDYFEKINIENPQTLLNPQRMMRFVEVCIGTEKPYSSFLNQKKNERSFTPILIGLEAERNVMYNRINQRVDTMLAEGLLQEAKSLYSNKELNALQTVGYRELFSYFDKEFSLEFAIEEIKKNTRRFAKRQLTWFKRDENTKWFHFETPTHKIIDYIENYSLNNLPAPKFIKMPISDNFTSILSKEYEINFTQCLPSGNLKYTELCNLLQLTAATHSEIGGISFSDMQEFDQAWVLSRMRVEIIDLPKWKDTVTVKTWINSLENSRSVRALEMYVNGKKMVGCETFWAVFNTKKRRPELLTLAHDHFELFPDIKATQEGFSKIEINPEKEDVFSKTVILSDLDIVNHVNNVKYLEWCMDLVDENIILKQKIKSFEMNFMKELSLRDQVMIHENVSDDVIVFSITKEDKNCFALQLNLE